MDINEELLTLLGKTIIWNERHYKVLSISIEPEGVQVWCEDHTWYYLRDGEWLVYGELEEDEQKVSNNG